MFFFFLFFYFLCLLFYSSFITFSFQASSILQIQLVCILFSSVIPIQNSFSLSSLRNHFHAMTSILLNCLFYLSLFHFLHTPNLITEQRYIFELNPFMFLQSVMNDKLYLPMSIDYHFHCIIFLLSNL